MININEPLPSLQDIKSSNQSEYNSITICIINAYSDTTSTQDNESSKEIVTLTPDYNDILLKLDGKKYLRTFDTNSIIMITLSNKITKYIKLNLETLKQIMQSYTENNNQIYIDTFNNIVQQYGDLVSIELPVTNLDGIPTMKKLEKDAVRYRYSKLIECRQDTEETLKKIIECYQDSNNQIDDSTLSKIVKEHEELLFIIVFVIKADQDCYRESFALNGQICINNSGNDKCIQCNKEILKKLYDHIQDNNNKNIYLKDLHQICEKYGEEINYYLYQSNTKLLYNEHKQIEALVTNCNNRKPKDLINKIINNTLNSDYKIIGDLFDYIATDNPLNNDYKIIDNSLNIIIKAITTINTILIKMYNYIDLNNINLNLENLKKSEEVLFKQIQKITQYHQNITKEHDKEIQKRQKNIEKIEQEVWRYQKLNSTYYNNRNQEKYQKNYYNQIDEQEEYIKLIEYHKNNILIPYHNNALVLKININNNRAQYLQNIINDYNKIMTNNDIIKKEEDLHKKINNLLIFLEKIQNNIEKNIYDCTECYQAIQEYYKRSIEILRY